MKLSGEEKAARRAAFQAMSPAKKAEHIFTYYKWPILLGLLALLVLGSALRRELTRKEPAVALAFLNVSVGEDLERRLTEDFLAEAGFDARKREVALLRDLYISEDADTLNHEYAYASRMKLFGAVSARELDLVLMNREAFDVLSRNGFLLDLSDLLTGDDPALPDLSPLLTENEVVLSDNGLEVLLGEAEEEERVTQRVPDAIAVGSLPLFRSAGMDGEIYLGVVANSTRLEEAAAYLRYISVHPG